MLLFLEQCWRSPNSIKETAELTIITTKYKTTPEAQMFWFNVRHSGALGLQNQPLTLILSLLSTYNRNKYYNEI